MQKTSSIAERIAIMRATGVSLSRADEERIAQSVASGLDALDKAVPGSLFDTEPLHFERALLRGSGRKDLAR